MLRIIGGSIYRLIICFMLMLATCSLACVCSAEEKLFWLKETSAGTTSDGTGRYVLQLMDSTEPVKPETIKILEAGWWFYPSGNAQRRKYKTRYNHLAFKPERTDLEILVPAGGRANVFIRFEKDNIIYTTQYLNYFYGQGADATKFLEARGEKAPAGPFMAAAAGRPVETMRPDFYLQYTKAIPNGSTSVKVYDEQLKLEGTAQVDNRSKIAYKAKALPRLSLTPDKRNFRRHVVVAEEAGAHKYVTNINVLGYRYRSEYMELGQGLMLALATMLITGGALAYYIKRRLSYASR